MRRTLLLAVVALMLALGGVVAAVALTRDKPVQATPRPAGRPVPFAQRAPVAQPAPLPDATLDGFADGPPVDLSDYRGRPLVVNFWASWCAPCVAEMPMFNRVARDLGDAVAFLGVDYMDAPSRAEPFAAGLDLVYDLAIDADGTFLADVGGFGMPTTLFVDEDGTIVHRVTGELAEHELRDLLATHLEVPA